MAETMALALEGRLENFTLGPSVDPTKVSEIAAIADRQGFKMSGFRRFERAIPDDEVEQIRKRAEARSGRPAAAAAAESV